MAGDLETYARQAFVRSRRVIRGFERKVVLLPGGFPIKSEKLQGPLLLSGIYVAFYGPR